MRLLSVAKAAAVVLAFTPLVASASPITPKYGAFQLGNPFLSYFVGTTGNATTVTSNISPLLLVDLQISSTDLTGGSTSTATGTFVNFDGGGLAFAKDANTLSLTDFHLDYTTGQFDAIVTGDGMVLGRRDIFHTQIAPSIGQQLGLQITGGTAAAPGPEFNFVTLLGQFGVSVGKGAAGTFTLVPEPGAIALFGLGAAMLGLARRRAK